MAESACEDDLKFSLLVEGVVIKAQTETTNEKSEIIRDVIRFHINTWLDQVEQFDAAYKVSELIPVGSYAEGTKIIRADEFDYLAVIEALSKPDVIKVDASESEINHGLVKVVVADEKLKLKWSKLCKDGHLNCFQPINFPVKVENYRFGHVVIETLWKFVRNSTRKGPTAGSPTDIDCKILLPAVNGVSLYFKGALFRAPNVILNFEYENRDVSVDVSPAIRYHKIHDCFKVEDCAGPEFAELVLRRKSLLLVGTEGESYFKVTLTEAEVEYILTVMKPEHKIIYVFLKYIVKLYERVLMDTFTSYMMKTVCFHHDIKCQQNNRSIKDCFKSVINDLNFCTAQQFVVSIVNKRINLNYLKIHKETDVNKDRQCLLQGMTAMCQVPAEIETIEDFDRFMKQIVDIERQKRYKAEVEREEMDRECRESFKAELEERVSDLVAMGFDPDEVKDVMENTLYDSELAIRILQKQHAKEREKEMIKESSSTSGGIPIQVSETHSINETCSNDGVSGTLPVSANSSQGRSSGSEEFLLAVYNIQDTTVTHEILYQRKKDV